MIIIFLAMAIPLLAVAGVFAVMANSSQRRGKSGSPGTASFAKQGRAADPDD
jgi:flagellar basal body-associated protein FliL